MTILDTGAPSVPAPAELDDFDLDVKVAVSEDFTLPEAGFTCSWYTCGHAGCGGGLPNTVTSFPAKCC